MDRAIAVDVAFVRALVAKLLKNDERDQLSDKDLLCPEVAVRRELTRMDDVVASLYDVNDRVIGENILGQAIMVPQGLDLLG